MSKKLDRLSAKRRAIRAKNDRIEDLVLEALELDAPTVSEVVEYVESHIEFDVYPRQIMRTCYRIMGMTDEIPTSKEDDLLLL